MANTEQVSPSILAAPAMSIEDAMNAPEGVVSDEAWALRQLGAQVLTPVESEAPVPGNTTISDELLETVHTNHQRAVDASVAAIKSEPQEAE